MVRASTHDQRPQLQKCTRQHHAPAHATKGAPRQRVGPAHERLPLRLRQYAEKR